MQEMQDKYTIRFFGHYERMAYSGAEGWDHGIPSIVCECKIIGQDAIVLADKHGVEVHILDSVLKLNQQLTVEEAVLAVINICENCHTASGVLYLMKEGYSII